MQTLETILARHICCTSVDDGKSSLKNETSLPVLQEALEYERSHMKRKSMVSALEARLRVLGRQKMKILSRSARQINGETA